MHRPLRPIRHAQSPALGEVLSRGSNPSIDQSIADRLGRGIQASLLGLFVRMIEIELIHKLVERQRELR